MKLESRHFSPRRGSGGLSLGLFVLVALAGMTTTPTDVFADVGEVEDGSVQAPGGERQAETPRPSDAVDMSTWSGDGNDGQGFLRPTKPSAEEREAENVDETSRLGDEKREAAPSAVPTPVTGVELPQGEPEVNGSKAPPASGPETDKGLSDAEQQPVPPLEEEEEGDVSTPSDSPPPMVSAAAAVPSDSVDGVRTMSSVPAVPQEGVQDQVQLSVPVSSPPTSVESTARPADASLGTVRATALRETGAGGPANEKAANVEGSQELVETHSRVAAAAAPSAPVAQGSADSQPKADVDTPPSEPVAPGPKGDQAMKGETGSPGQDVDAPPPREPQPADREEAQHSVPQNQDQDLEQHQQQEQQQQEQQTPKPENDQAGGQGNQTPSPTSSTTITTTTSDSATNKRVWSSTVALLAVVPFLLTA
ncbi:hypothetical protein CSUI_010002 [Cystoisospora suis]|uniref:Uncharacterized protein n=1 Tax=Cystoisospora suis TaxID=483139 RepID=A0A2C6KIL0_9APIC|nr:hypothetical protein CSUI_010002 [Cystoisospora suis]